MTLRKIIIAVVLIFGIFALNSCKTTKKKGEVSKVGKFYQNTTSYYNGYFNANEIYNNSIASLNMIHQDDYSKILSLYPYRDIPDAKSVSQDMDKVIEKLGRVINLHRAADWVDDSYLLMGKAQYVKQDFEKAQSVFEYFVDEMNPAYKKTNYKTKKDKKKEKAESRKKKKKERAKKKKEREKEKKRKRKERKKTKREKIKEEKERKAREKKEKLKNKKKEDKAKKSKTEIASNTTFHRKGTKEDWATYNEGLLWMTKTYIEREKWASAYYLLARLKTEAKNKTLSKEYPKVRAYYCLKQKKYADAIEPLKNAIKFAKKKDKTRLTYILAQVYEKTNNRADAYAMYKKVEELSSDYDLEFNAKLKVLENNSNSSDEYVAKAIKKLLKEEKYAEYRDKIYYTLGEIKFNNNDIAVAVENYNKSLKNNRNNDPLKADTYYKLASINFDRQKYIESKNYYDSTLLVMNKADEKYEEVKKFADNLKGIARNIEVIELQDSLIMISNLSKDEQMELAIAIKKKELEEKKLKEEKSKASSNKRSFTMNNNRGNGPSLSRSKNKSSFFAYNESSVRTGKIEFQSKWNGIVLEDNWRRSNKSDGEYDDEDGNSEDDEITLTDIEMNNILRAVPRTPDQLEKANAKIISAMLNLGILYRDKLNNYKKSAEILEKLMSRYSGFDEECKALYYLQFSYKDLNQYDKAQNVVNRMSNSFPDCTYTKLLTDPDFVNANKKKVNAKELYYNEIFNLYRNGDYKASLAKINNANEDFTKAKKYAIKVDYLKAKIVGKEEGKDKYILALENFIKKYPNTKESIHAKETLRFIKGDKDTFSKLIYEEDLSAFTYQKDKLHYILIVVNDVDDTELKNIKTSISNYNKKFHKLERIRMSSIYFDTKSKNQVILLRKFESAESAMKYFKEVSATEEVFIDNKYNFEMFAVSQKNYREVIKQHSVENYKEFFNKNYLENTSNEK